MAYPEQTDFALSAQRALLGQISSEIRAVTGSFEHDHVVLRFIFDGPIDPDTEDRLKVVGTEVLADFPWGYEITQDDEFVRVDSPASLSEHLLRHKLYWRYEGKEKGRSGFPKRPKSKPRERD